MSQRPEYKRFRQGDTCEEEGCRSRYYYVQDGRAYCKSHDHIQSTWRQVEQDEDDFNSQGRKTRKKREEKEKVMVVLSGKDSAELLLNCWQLILWKQVSWLTKSKEQGGAGLPPELEEVVKGLWAMRLRTLVIEDAVEDLGFSSQSEFDSGDDTSGSEMTRSSSRGRKLNRLGPRLIESLALCYLGTVLMRLPVSVGDFHSWAEKENIIYIRAIRYVPKEMKSKLRPQYHASLDTRSPLKPDSLHKAILSLATILNYSTGIILPPINHHPLIFYHIKNLGLPLEIHLATHRLAALLSINYTFPLHSIPRLLISLSPEIQLICLIIIATKLAHPFENETLPRPPISQNDPAILKIDWDIWRATMMKEDRGVKKNKGGLVKGQEIRVAEDEAFKMNGKELDDYMDWYQRTFVEGDDEEQRIPSQLLRLFPLPTLTPAASATSADLSPQPNSTSQPTTDSSTASPNPSLPLPHPSSSPKITTIQKSLKYQTPSQEQPSNLSLPGKNYIHYRTTASLPSSAKTFYEVAAKHASISLSSLVRAVFLTEQKLVGWMMAERRKGLGEEFDLGNEEDEFEE